MKTLFLCINFLFFLLNISFAQVLDGFEDDFNNNVNLWAVSDGNESASKIENGKYIISHKREDKSWYFYKDVYLDPQKDFYIESSITQVSGIDNNGYGIVFGTSDANNNYNFVVSSNGMYSLYKFEKGNYLSLKDWKSDNNINALGKANVFAIRKKGALLHFSINGKEIFTFPYSNFFGLKVGFVLNWRMSVAVDYIKVKQSYTINTIPNASHSYKKENLGANINSQYDEVGPVITQNGKTLFIDRKDHPDNMGKEVNDDIWYSEFLAGIWQKVKNMPKPLNNVGHNFIFSVSPDENTMLVANEYNADGSLGSNGVSITHRTAKGWEIPKRLDIEDFYNLDEEESFCLSADRKKLFMSVERKDSYGKKDIYISFLQKNKKWSIPKNIGPAINSLGMEVTPYLASDNVTLYFSSNGKPGYGSNDIFVSKRLDDSWTNWSEPQNLGPDINGPGWDAYYSTPASGEYAYFVSDEPPSLGSGDIFRIKLINEAKPDPVVVIYGKVLNKTTNKPIDAEIIYYDLITNEEIGIARSNPKDGTYRIVLPYGRAYGFHAEKKGFYSETDNIDLTMVKEYKEIENNLLLAPIEIGKKIALNNVFFERSKAILLPTSDPELDRLVKIMIDNPELNIEVAGHTDNVGSAELNQKLSEERVAAIIKYLVDKGISAKRLRGKGYGQTRPVASNSTEETRRLNRRVEFTIVK